MLGFLNKNNISELNPDNIGAIISSLMPIDVSGADANVYKFKNKAIHHYEDTPPEKVELYTDLVGLSKRLLDGEQTEVDGKIVTLNILPIQDLIKTNNDGVFTISEFVGGDNLYTQLKNGIITRAKYRLYEIWLGELTDKLMGLTGYRGLELMPYNSKLDESSSILTATDVAGMIYTIRKGR